MSRYIEHEHERDDDVDRRGFLKCMAWAGTGVVFTVAGCGVATQRLGTRSAAKATGSFSFVQISDSHIGFDKAANKNVIGTLELPFRTSGSLFLPPTPRRLERS